MADRLKKPAFNAVSLKNPHNRHGSVDDHPHIISSTNDSKVEDMLPNVILAQGGSAQQQYRSTNKSVQMRSTLYNNPYFQKLLSNVQR
jgi:hypothetical protein